MNLEPVPFQLIVQPRAWKGVRDNVAPNKLEDVEWVDSREVDTRFAKRRSGMSQISLVEGATSARALATYLRVDGTKHRLVLTGNGNLYEDAGVIKSGVSIASFPDFAFGAGSIFLTNGSNLPFWRDPADGVWKDLQNVPGTWLPKYCMYHPLSRRLYLAPTAAGIDYFAWTNPSFVGTDVSFKAVGGGGSEALGTGEPITGIIHGLGDDTCIFTTDHIFQIRGLDPSSWRPRFVSGDLGCVAHRTINVIGHGTFFMHTSGCYLVNALGAVTFPALTEPKSRAWDVLRKTYENYLQYAHASWSADEHTVYLFIPTTSTNLMGQLWKFYLPDGSISIHDIAAYDSFYEAPGKMLIARSDGKVVDLLSGNDDLGTPITGWLRSKVYGEIDRIRTWGIQQKIPLAFKPLTGGTVQVQPTIYRTDPLGPVAGTLQTIALDSTGDEVRATLTLPASPGWGLQLYITGTAAWEWLGFAAEGITHDIE